MIKRLCKELQLEKTVITGYQPQSEALQLAALKLDGIGILNPIAINSDLVGEERETEIRLARDTFDVAKNAFILALDIELESLAKKNALQKESAQLVQMQRREFNQEVQDLIKKEIDRLLKGFDKNSPLYANYREQLELNLSKVYAF